MNSNNPPPPDSFEDKPPFQNPELIYQHQQQPPLPPDAMSFQQSSPTFPVYQLPPAVPQGYIVSPQPSFGVPVYGSPPQQHFQFSNGENFEMKSMYPSQQPGYAPFNEEAGLETMPRVSFPPGVLDKDNFQDLILSQEYQVNIRKWFSLSWNVYKQHWIAFVLFAIFHGAILFLPYLGYFLAFPLNVGIFLAVSNKIRFGDLNAPLKYDHFFYGFLYYIPILLISFFVGIFVIIGFFLCIIPGLYALIALSFSMMVFFEYHSLDIGLFGAMILSQRVVNKQFFEVTAFLIINFLLAISGLLLFGVGAFVTIPLSQIMFVFAFRDIFGLNPQKAQPRTLVVC